MSTNETSRRCDAAIASRNLLAHPFYRAWSAGTLSVDALCDYAREYGAFIGTIADGWRTLGEDWIAGHEVEHARLWEQTFAAELGTVVAAPQTAQVQALLDTARECFATPAGAVGALYAFEAQQPETARSKLDGLRTHYRALPAACGDYFELHSGDYDETTLLIERMRGMAAAEAECALGACTRMSQALYDALSGIHAPYATCAD